MRALALDIRTQNGFKRPGFSVDKSIRDVLADHFRRLYPANGTKLLAKDFGLSLDEAKGVLAGRCSLNSLNHIIKRGGWSVLLPVMGAVIGESLDQHIEKQREDHAEQDRRRDALLRDLRSRCDSGYGAGH